MKHEHWRTIPGFTQVGKLGKTKGIDGAIKITIHEGMREAVLGSAFLFVDTTGNKVPFMVEDFEMSGDLYVLFSAFVTKEEVSHLVACDVFLPSDEVGETQPVKRALEYSFIEGFLLISNGVEVGRVIEIQEFPQQEIAVVQTGRGKVMIPVHQDLILNIDEEQLKIEMELPEGILDL